MIQKTATTANSKPDPRWGTVYKVVIESDRQGAEEKQIREEEYSHRASRKRARDDDCDSAKSGEEDVAAKSSSKSSSADSSSSSGKDTKKKKSKSKDKKRSKKLKKGQKSTKEQAKNDAKEAKRFAQQQALERKAQLRQQALTDKQALKEKAVRLALASRLIGKLSPLEISLKAALAAKNLKNVPEFAITKAKDCKRKIDSFLKQARDVIEKKEVELGISIEGISELAAESTSAEKLLRSLILTVAGHTA